jgi:hypothetical protein
MTSSFVSDRSLAPGSYEVSVTATDADNNRSGPRTASFRVVR